MNVSRIFIERPIGTALLAVGLFLVGAVAYFMLPVASMPAIEIPTIRIMATRPGADPATMAASVASPLERRLGEIAGVTEMTSTSSLGSTSTPSRSSTSTATSMLRRATCRPRSTPQPPICRAIFRRCRPIASITRRPMPMRARADLEHDADERDFRRDGFGYRAAHLAGAGRRRGAHRRRRSAGDPRASRPDARRFDGSQLRRRQERRHGRQRSGAHRLRRCAEPDHRAAIQLADDGTRGLQGYRRQEHAERRRRQSRGCRQGRQGNAQLPVFGTVRHVTGRASHHHQDGGRKRHRYGRSGEGCPAAAQGMDSGRHRHFHSNRPHDDNPCFCSRHADHAGPDDPARDVGRIRLPAPRRRRHRRGHHGAAIARRDLRGDVGRRHSRSTISR